MKNESFPVHVGMVSEVYYPNLPGGLLRFFRYGPGMKERGIRFHMHTKREPEHAEPELEANGILITRHVLPEGLSHHKERQILLGHACEDLHRRRASTAICVQPNGVTWSSAVQMWKARLSGIPLVFSFSMFPDEPPPGLVKRARHWGRMRFLDSPFQRFIVCSERMRLAFRRVAGIPLSRIELLRNGVDLEKFTPVEAAAKRRVRESRGIDPNAEVVFYAGSITRRKGIDLLLEAWPRILAARPDARLLLAGSLGRRMSFRDPAMRADLDDFTGEVHQTLDAMDGRESVILLGDCDQVVDYYRAADVFVFPSRLEGLPNAVLEAMASGLPSIVSPFTGIPDDGEEFGISGREFLRTSHDAGEIARDVIGLLADPDRRAAMGAAARAWMLRHQSIEATLDKLAGIYRRVAARPR